MNYRDVARDSNRAHVRRAKTSRTSAMHTISTGPLLLRRCTSHRKTRSPTCLPACLVSPFRPSHLPLPLQPILSETTHVSFSALGLSDGGFVFAGDKHRLRAKCARSRLLEIAQVAYPRHSSSLSFSLYLSPAVVNPVCMEHRLFGSISVLAPVFPPPIEPI